MLEDKFAEYISGYDSPFEKEDIDPDEIVYDGLMRFYRDAMLKSIGTSESNNQFVNYFEEFYDQCDDDQKTGFLKSCIDKIVKHYKMPYFMTILDESNHSNDELKDFVLFISRHKFIPYLAKCLSKLDSKILNNDAMLKVFLTSDYESFMSKIDTYKRCNNLIREYFKYCAKQDGIETVLSLLKDDILEVFIEQTQTTKQ